MCRALLARVSRNFSTRLRHRAGSTRGARYIYYDVQAESDVPTSSREYLPELQRARAAREKSLKTVKDESMSRFMKDLTLDREKNPAAAAADRWDPAEDEEDEDEDDLDMNIIDRSAYSILLRPSCLRANSDAETRGYRRGCVARAVY